MAEYIDKTRLLATMRDSDMLDKEEIAMLPNEDVAPVVHGKWTKDYDECCYHWICSVCKGDIPRDKYQDEMFSDYCPNCGAKMDGGIENAS